ncbi:MAG: PAS domain S-box protein [Armatimonadetes bacterium]|nr:PAS domain S-box protein [Armatimonadota bacterium]
MRWIRPGLPDLVGRHLLESLEAACLQAGAPRGWVLLSTSGPRSSPPSTRAREPDVPEGKRFELLASLGTSAPSRQTLTGIVPEVPVELTAAQLHGLCPFRVASPVRVFPLGRGALFLEGRSAPAARMVEKITLCLERIEVEREVEALRQKVQGLGQELEAARQSRLLGDIERTGRRAEALSSWYRYAAGMLASSHLETALPDVAQRAQALLEIENGCVLVKEPKRIRLWGGEPLRRVLGTTFLPRRLGSIGRRVLEEGEMFISSQEPARMARNKLFSKLGLKSLMAVPMKVDGRVLGALVLAGSTPRVFQPDEIDLIRLMAYQSALFLENSLLVSGADLERVVARAVLDSMADGVFTLDWEKRITSFNPAAEAITGWPAEKAIGRTCDEVMRPQYLCPGGRTPGGCGDNCPLLAMLADQKLMDSGLTVEGTIRTADGEMRYVSSTYSVVADRGDLLGAVVLFRDITEKKAIEQMKSDYAAALSHDLKTPLTAMKGYAVTLLRHGQKLNEETRHDALEVINSEIDRVTRMFDNLLHQARIEAGVNTRNVESVPLADAVRKVINLHQFSTRRHKLSYKVPRELEVRADPDHLDQILNNLISNAVKYSPGGCRIEVVARGVGKDALVEVTDDGAGIAQDQLHYVFERFRRVEDRLSRHVRGSGLGLYITRMLVEGSGGEVGVRSQVGQGSTFWFKLPLARRNRDPVVEG